MTPLGLKWALVVWGYALAWFLVTDRVKLLAYRLLDPVKDKPPTDKTGAATAPAGALSEAGPAVDLRAEAGPKAGEAGPQATVAAFHAGSGPAGVYHDNSGCAYGQELKANGHSKPGKRGRRRCDWCTQHAA
jgi:H+-transporting ATPase